MSLNFGASAAQLPDSGLGRPPPEPDKSTLKHGDNIRALHNDAFFLEGES